MVKRLVRPPKPAPIAITPATPALPAIDPVDDADLLARVADEIGTKHERGHVLALTLRPSTAFDLAGLIQLALRHPGLGVRLQQQGAQLVGAVRTFYGDSPGVLAVLAAGDGKRG